MWRGAMRSLKKAKSAALWEPCCGSRGVRGRRQIAQRGLLGAGTLKPEAGGLGDAALLAWLEARRN